jgi:hypothetical protein
MLGPGDRITRPFGSRRGPAGRNAPVAAEGASGPAGAAGSSRLVARTLRAAAIAGALAVAAVHQLSRLDLPETSAGAARMAQDRGYPAADPETTGAIPAAGAARLVRLDPCALPVPGPLRP